MVLLLTILLGALVYITGFFLGYGAGWTLNLMFGTQMTDGLNIFGLAMIPLLFGIIGLIAAFFGILKAKRSKNNEINKNRI